MRSTDDVTTTRNVSPWKSFIIGSSQNGLSALERHGLPPFVKQIEFPLVLKKSELCALATGGKPSRAETLSIGVYNSISIGAFHNPAFAGTRTDQWMMRRYQCHKGQSTTIY
jgi:hypothetical protein